MASNTTEGVCLPTTCSLVTAAAGGPATSEDQFDPFLPAIEPAVDELSLQQSMDVNKECKYCLLFFASRIAWNLLECQQNSSKIVDEFL